jgi:hypothetical protein
MIPAYRASVAGAGNALEHAGQVLALDRLYEVQVDPRFPPALLVLGLAPAGHALFQLAMLPCLSRRKIA